MRSISFALLIYGLGFLPVGCGVNEETLDDEPALQPPAPLKPKYTGSGKIKIAQNHFVIAPEVPTHQQDALIKDFNTIAKFDAHLGNEKDRELMDNMGVGNLRGETLSKWLKDRVRYLVGEKLEYYNFAAVFPSEQSYGYFNLEDEEDGIDSDLTGAVNVGAGLYSFSRQLVQDDSIDQYLRMQINDNWVDISSPRVGIVQIGPALFGITINSYRLDSYSNAALRIETLFHEARHSDGNRQNQSLGFFHVECTEEAKVPTELVGRPACDNSSNGPYAIGAGILNAYYEKCGDRCTIEEKELLRIYYIDNRSRVIAVDGVGAKPLDATPEGNLPTVDISTFRQIPLESR